MPGLPNKLTGLLLCLALASAWAGVGGVFQAQGIKSDGVVNLAPALGGQYVYGEVRPDARPNMPAFTLTPPPRSDYVFLSPQEIDALVAIQRQQTARHQTTHAPGRRRTTRPALKLNWPRVVIVNQQICVPELAYSQDPDWKDHLTCVSQGGKP